MKPSYSFIVPVFNRPQEIRELLNSFVSLKKDADFELIIVEDGSEDTIEEIVKEYKGNLPIRYTYQENQGPGKARNLGAEIAQYDYLIFLDSDVLLVQDYLMNINDHLNKIDLDCFGGPDKDHEMFSDLQKAVDFSMTSFLTTGGIRGKKGSTKDYEPRSFNLGIKKELFREIGGFAQIHPGEDPELIMRLRKHKASVKIGFIPSAQVIHKRRISIKKFAKQLYKFGLVRPIISRWHPGADHITFYFPIVFSVGFIVSLFSMLLGYYSPFLLYLAYTFALFTECLYKKRDWIIALLSILTTYIQFFSYGAGFLNSYVRIKVFGNKAESVFPHLFFSTK